MIELLLMAAAQVQTIKLPPVAPGNPAPATVQRETPTVPDDINNLPDLVISDIRIIGGQAVEFAVENRGPAATAAPVRISGCAHFVSNETLKGMGITDQDYCSRHQATGPLGAGESRWVRIQCFLSPARFGATSGGDILGPSGVPTSTPPQCISISDREFAKYSATADPAPNTWVEGPRPTPSALETECDLYRGCIQEINEKNNSAVFEVPFPG